MASGSFCGGGGVISIFSEGHIRPKACVTLSLPMRNELGESRRRGASSTSGKVARRYSALLLAARLFFVRLLLVSRQIDWCGGVELGQHGIGQIFTCRI